MAKHRFVVIREFDAWIPGERDDPERRLCPMRTGPGPFLLADIEQPGAYVAFDLDAIAYEVDRRTFMNSARLARPDEVPPPPY
jgi:hypothetical protein